MYVTNDPYYDELGPVMQALYREAQNMPWDEREIEENDPPNVYIDDDPESVQSFIEDINSPDIRSKEDVEENFQQDLERFPRLLNVAELGASGDFLLHCYGDFPSYIHNLEEEVSHDLDFSMSKKDGFKDLQRDVKAICANQGSKHGHGHTPYGDILFHDVDIQLFLQKQQGNDEHKLVGIPRYPSTLGRKDAEAKAYLTSKDVILFETFSPSLGDHGFSEFHDKDFQKLVKKQVAKYFSKELEKGVPQSVRKAISHDSGEMKKELAAFLQKHAGR